MIDHDKLMKAYDLVAELAKTSSDYIGISTHAYFKGRDHLSDDLRINLCMDGETVHFETIDDLINKLKELTKPKPKPKYKVGDKIFYPFIRGDEMPRIRSGEVREVCFADDAVQYGLDGFEIPELWAYSSRDELIETQIEYWNARKLL